MDLSEAFENAGFVVTPCSTLEETRDALIGNTFALVVLDVVLPDGDGVEFLLELKANPQTAAIPVMLLSTEAEVRDRIHGLQTGAEEYVGKPYDSGHVVARARELVRLQQPRSVRSTTEERATILVIDDSATFRHAMRAALEAVGYKVTTSSTGEEGLHAAVNHRPAAVIVDHGLPGIDGATVVRRIREDAILRRTPCLLLTGSEDRSQELRALEAGADGFVRKDEDLSVVLARLAAVLRSAGVPSAQDSQASVLRPKRVLAVDDSDTYLEALAAHLRAEGYDVVLAHSGEAALELLSVQSVDCILLDLIMPGLSGHETCQRIKDSQGLRDTPLLILTGVEDRQSMIEVINAGADDYIPKSSDFDIVRARVRAALRRKQFEDENRSVREQLLRKEMEAAEARAQRELAEARETLLGELRESEARFRALADNMSQFAWMADEKGSIFWYNQRWFDYTGTTLEEMRSCGWRKVHHPNHMQRVVEKISRCFHNGQVWEDTFPLRARDGSYRWFLSRAVPIRDEQGQVLRWFGTNTDITEQRQAEEAVQQSKDRLDFALEAGGLGEWEIDLKTHAMSTSRRHDEIFGYDSQQQDWSYELLLEHVLPEHRAEVDASFKAALANNSVWNVETRIRRKDGVARWITSRGQIAVDQDAKPVTMIGTNMDITARKQAELALQEREQQLRAILDLLPVAVFMCDADGKLIQANPAADQIWGASVPLVDLPQYREYKGRRPGTGHPLESSEWALARAVLQGETTLDDEVEIEAFDGTRKTILISALPVRGHQGEILGGVAVNVDITERKRAEKALIRSEKLASVGRMAATIAHEVNNPLAGATNALFLVGSDPDLSASARKYLDMADRELRRAAHMVKQTLGFYREMGKVTTVLLPEILDEVRHLFDQKLKNSTVRVESRYESQTPIHAIEGEMRQMVSNLMVNSIDAMSQSGTLFLRTSGSVCVDQRPMVTLTIADTGTGIADEHKKRIFEPFFTTQKTFGTGLGLWVTSEIVRKHDGRIRIRSRVGKGTVVKIWLPVERRNEER